MRVIVDASPLLLRSAGVKNYLFYWLRHLERLSGKHRLRAFPFMPPCRDLLHERSVLDVVRTAPRLATLFLVNIRPNPAIHWIARSCDIFHATNQIRQPVRAARLTATMHDLTCWLMPEVHTPANIRADREFAENILNRADGLISVSENTRQDAIRILGLPPERVVTIHSGVAESFFEASEAMAREAAERYCLLKPYILFTGTIEPRKNVDALLAGYRQLPPSVRQEYELVVVGPMGWADAETASGLVNTRTGVRYLGYVPERDLPGLTRGATVFAYPSLYEGFGFPVAQALACGVPVLTSNCSCLPEIAGPGGLLVDPRSPGAIARGLDRLLSSPELRASLGAAGRKLAQERYRWELTARRSWEFFESVHKGESRLAADRTLPSPA
jgi:alpha-1,3-rhamnosyl/mannosyltransferase